MCVITSTGVIFPAKIMSLAKREKDAHRDRQERRAGARKRGVQGVRKKRSYRERVSE